jgi:hypothetical protein
VEEPVEAAGRPYREVAPLDQNRREAAQRSVADDACPGRAAAYDQHFRFQSAHATSQYRSARLPGSAGDLPEGPAGPSGRFAVG